MVSALVMIWPGGYQEAALDGVGGGGVIAGQAGPERGEEGLAEDGERVVDVKVDGGSVAAPSSTSRPPFIVADLARPAWVSAPQAPARGVATGRECDGVPHRSAAAFFRPPGNGVPVAR
jgi:hypothetical protein